MIHLGGDHEEDSIMGPVYYSCQALITLARLKALLQLSDILCIILDCASRSLPDMRVTFRCAVYERIDVESRLNLQS